MAEKKGASSEKNLYCSFCGKSQHEVKKLIAGPSVFVCDECIDLCNEIIRDEVPSITGDGEARSDLPTPSEIKANLDNYVIGQEPAKRTLADFGLPVPKGQVVPATQVAGAAHALGYPVVLKAVSAQLAHKTEAGAVHLNLANAEQVQTALNKMAHLSDQFLVEQMASNVVAEVIVGVQRDAQFGLSLTVGAGGVLVELLQDARTLLLPVQRDEVQAALESLRIWPLLRGFRGKPAGDVPALVDAVMAVADYAQSHAHSLLELDVNPVLVMPHGVLAVDALIRCVEPNP